MIIGRRAGGDTIAGLRDRAILSVAPQVGLRRTEIAALKVGDPPEVVGDPEARYFGGRVEEYSLVPLGEARLGRIGLDEWLRHSQAEV